VVRGAFVAREEDRQPFVLQRPQDAGVASNDARSTIAMPSRNTRLCRTNASTMSASLRTCAAPSSRTTWGRSAPVYQHADQEARDRGSADRRPWVVVHVIVGDARGGACAIGCFAFQFLQPQLGGEQLGLDLRAEILGALAGLVAGALQQILGVAQHRRKVIE